MELDPDPDTVENVRGDVYSMLINCAFWTLVLVAIEMGLAKKCHACYTKCFVRCHNKKT